MRSGPFVAVGWLPDGNTLVYPARYDHDAIYYTHSHLGWINLNTMEAGQITRPRDGEGEDILSVSPDGRHVAFRRYRSRFVGDLFVVPIDGRGRPTGPERRLTTDQTVISDIDWSPDSKRIVFSAHTGEVFGLWSIGLDGTARKGETAHIDPCARCCHFSGWANP